MKLRGSLPMASIFPRNPHLADGAIVTAAPDILFLRDANGDGVADEPEVLITGLSEGNQQFRANGLRWGLTTGSTSPPATTATTAPTPSSAPPARTRKPRWAAATSGSVDTGELEPERPNAVRAQPRRLGTLVRHAERPPALALRPAGSLPQRNPYFAAPNGQVQVLGEVAARLPHRAAGKALSRL